MLFIKNCHDFLSISGLITYCVVASVNGIPFTPVKDSMYIAGINAGSVFMGCATLVCTIYKYYAREWKTKKSKNKEDWKEFDFEALIFVSEW